MHPIQRAEAQAEAAKVSEIILLDCPPRLDPECNFSGLPFFNDGKSVLGTALRQKAYVGQISFLSRAAYNGDLSECAQLIDAALSGEGISEDLNEADLPFALLRFILQH
jgi:hypothetical protein